MRTGLRRLFGHLTLTVFLASLCLPFLTASHFAWDDDPACGSDVLAPAHATTQFEPVIPGPVAQHCAICHWLRALGSASPAGSPSARPFIEARREAPARDFVAPERLVAGDRWSRGPPSTSL